MQVVEIHTFVGIVTFDSKGEIRAQLQQINSDNDRRLLVSYLPTTVSTEEETNTCAGVKRGFEVGLPELQLSSLSYSYFESQVLRGFCVCSLLLVVFVY